jgi:ubiquinone/menaquinone biosynthesis C-methylase UbiE
MARENPYGSILEGVSNPEEFWNYSKGLEVVELAKTMKVINFLDLGCGIGRIARHIAPFVVNYIGIDVSVEMIAVAGEFHKSFSNVKFIATNGKDLSIFDDGSINMVYHCLVFQHISKENIVSYIKEVHRVLAEDGIFYCLNIPRRERYECGFDGFELLDLLNPLYDITVINSNEYYFHYIMAKKPAGPKGL